MTRFNTTLISALIALGVTTMLSACGPDKVSFDTLETNRGTAKDNAEYNAKKYRGDSPQFSNFAIEAQGDSSQTPECPQGDGWASIKLTDKDNPARKVGLKCSTVSASVGCMTSDEFAKKPYAADDGRCQDTSKVPFPLPKVAK